MDDILASSPTAGLEGFHCIEWLHKHWIVTRGRIHCTNESITPEVFESIRCQLGIAGGVLTGRTDIEVEISNQCARLIANAIIYYNSAILSRLVAKYEASGNTKALALIK